MTILLTSGNPLGLRAVGSGGRTAVSSYEQITRTLRQMFGPAHAALFAEPSQRAAAIDWYADVESGGKPVRLSEAPPGIRDPGLERLETLVRDIEAKAVSLQKSDRQDERILGDMLAHALEIPDEDAVFLVGGQPVMTFWGLRQRPEPPRDQPDPYAVEAPLAVPAAVASPGRTPAHPPDRAGPAGIARGSPAVPRAAGAPSGRRPAAARRPVGRLRVAAGHLRGGTPARLRHRLPA